MKKRIIKNNGQAILIMVVMCASVFLTIVLGVVEPIMNEVRISSDLLRSKASLYVAESSSEDAVYRVKNDLISNYATPMTLSINEYKATSIVPDTIGIKTITTTGTDDVNFRKIEAKIVAGVGADFYYGVQAGIGGFLLTGGSKINGSVYSNGPIDASNGVQITGSAVSANPSSTTTGYVGGGPNVQGVDVGTAGVGDVWAHSVVGANVEGTMYCQISSKTNKACDTSRADPPQEKFPITEKNIAIWKDFASASSTYHGSMTVSTSTTIGPLKITGDLDVQGTLILTGTVYVVGDITFSNGGKVRLDPGYGQSGGVVVSDGEISIVGGASFAGSGEPNSFPLIITTSSSANAIDVHGGAGAVVLVAESGTLNLSGGTSARSLVANRVVVDTGGEVTYDVGLVNFNFSNGPSGGWNISSWKEVQ